MNTLPPQPESKAPLQETPVTPPPVVEVRSSSILTNKPLSTKLSWGEQLLPFLFAAMETCWIDATLAGLASINLLGTGQPLVPVWIPFVLVAGFYMLTRAAYDRSGKRPIRLLLVSSIVLVSLSTVWASIYGSRIFLLDPGWLINLPDALVQVDAKSFQIVTVAAIAWTLCRRGMQLAYNRIHPQQVARVIRFGTIVIIVLLVMRAIAVNFGKTFSDDTVVWLLIALFFCLSLIAHALAKLSFVRYYHPTGLSGSIAMQERIVVQVILAASTAFLLLALIVVSLFTGKNGIFTSLQRGLAWLWQAIASLFKPEGLFRPVPHPLPCHFGSHCPQPTPVLQARPTAGTLPTLPSPPNNPLINYLSTPVVALLTILLIALLIIAVSIVLVFVVRRLLKHRSRRIGDLHESLWSWALFWTQFKNMLRTIRVRLPWLHALHSKHILPEEENLAPTASNIREMYRAVLINAAKLGHPRSHDETPYEFSSRLAQQLPFVEPQLSSITEAYTLTRYGGLIPDEVEVTRLRKILIALEQKGLK